MAEFRNPVKAKLRSGGLSIGSWIQFGHAGIVEVMADAGFDWLAFDCEHGEMNSTTFVNAARGIGSSPTVPMVRVRHNSLIDIRQALDGGAYGVFVPLINHEDEARRAVAGARYPPAGIRGYAFARSNRHGAAFDDYASRANQEIMVIAMVETKPAVDRVEEILAVDGIDGVFIGPYDLSGSYGVPGSIDHDVVHRACEKVVAAGTTAGKAVGMHIVRPTQPAVEEAIRAGYTLIAVGMDSTVLADGSRAALQYVALAREKR